MSLRLWPGPAQSFQRCEAAEPPYFENIHGSLGPERVTTVHKGTL